MTAVPPNSPYAGRWVARLRGKIIAQGGTPQQAYRAAKKSRHKEKPEIVYMPIPLRLPSIIDEIIDALPAQQPLYLIGGAVRDLLLGQTAHDLDFGLPGETLRLARRIADRIGAAYYPLDIQRGTARLVLEQKDGTRETIDFASLRGDSLEDDLRGRDFTLNAIALDLRTQELYDPLGGAADLQAKVLRACSPSAFLDDPIRILRGLRLAANFGFRILPETRQAMKKAVPGLNESSVERQRDELFKILEGKQVATALRAMEMLGILPQILPELTALKGESQSAPHVDDVWRHTLNTMRHLEDILAALSPIYDSSKAAELYKGLLVVKLGRYRKKIASHFSERLTTERSPYGLLFFAALYHDVAKPLTRKVDSKGRIRFFGHEGEGAKIAVERAEKLHLSKKELNRLEKTIRGHLRIHAMAQRMDEQGKQAAGNAGRGFPSRRVIYRFFRDTQGASLDLILLSLADLRATYEHTLPEALWKAELDVCRILLENLWEHPAETVHPPPLLNGHEVMAIFGLDSGPLVGALLEALREGQAAGDVLTREEALAFCRRWLSGEKLADEA